MARENQGLQIALIVFVMLTILLGVTTYLFFRKYDEASGREVANAAGKQEATNKASASAAEAAKLRQAIGLAPTDKADDVFTKDVQKFGSAYPEEARFYRPLLQKMQQTLDEKNKQLADAQEKLKKFEDEFRVREANTQPKLKAFEQERDKALADLAAEQAKLKDDRARISEISTKLNTDSASVRKAAETSVAKIEQKLQDTIKDRTKDRGLITKLSSDKARLLSETFEAAAGDIRWINQRTGTVWINLGRADALQRQITFSVYPSNAKVGTSVAKKASIEVTQVLGDHLAEARLYDDKIADPVVPGDKIFTPVWTPGEKRHFALAGFMDLDSDGKTDIMKVKEIIALNGGIVDAYVDEKGKPVGALTVNTRYLIQGVAPTEKGEANMSAWNKFVTDADRYGVEKVHVDDLLQQLGWKNQMKVVAYGAGSNPKDFTAKAEDDIQKKSVGSVSDVFTPRTPPARVPTAAH